MTKRKRKRQKGRRKRVYVGAPPAKIVSDNLLESSGGREVDSEVGGAPFAELAKTYQVNNTYAGESAGKKLARFYAYIDVGCLFSEFGRPPGWAVVLSGPEAAEYPLIRHILRIPTAETLLCDIDPTCCERAAARAVGDTIVSCGDIRVALRDLVAAGGKLTFVSLDVLGHIGDLVNECLEIIGPALNPGGVILLTFFRGRERQSQKDWMLRAHLAKKTLRRARRKRLRKLGTEAEDTRFAAAFNAVALRTGLTHLYPVHSSVYQSTSPMGMLGVQYMPPVIRPARYVPYLKAQGCIGSERSGGYVRIPRFTNDSDALRHVVTHGRKMLTKLSASEYADLWGISKGTIAAWLAWEHRKARE